MKTKTFSLIAAVSLVLSGMAFGVQDYQVTGPVAEINDSMIVVEKGAKKERFEVARDSGTKMSGDVKVGDKVTVHYTMTAKDVEVKAAKGEKGTKKEMKAAASPAASPKK
jgi:ribosomal 50S subunit-recycling heat shock protein